MLSKLALLLPVAGLTLGACNTANKRIGQEDAYLGEAVKYNAAVHTINPDPVYPEDAAQPGSSGDKAAAAVKRYRTDRVKDVKVQSTTGGAQSGSGGPN